MARISGKQGSTPGLLRLGAGPGLFSWLWQVDFTRPPAGRNDFLSAGRSRPPCSRTALSSMLPVAGSR